MKRLGLLAAIAKVHGACLATVEDGRRTEADSMNPLAERYVKLVLALGQHDPDYVDAYYGPPEWRKDAETAKRPLAEIDKDAISLQQSLASAAPAAGAEEI